MDACMQQVGASTQQLANVLVPGTFTCHVSHLSERGWERCGAMQRSGRHWQGPKRMALGRTRLTVSPCRRGRRHQGRTADRRRRRTRRTEPASAASPSRAIAMRRVWEALAYSTAWGVWAVTAQEPGSCLALKIAEDRLWVTIAASPRPTSRGPADSPRRRHVGSRRRRWPCD